MLDKLSLVVIPMLGIMVALSFSISNVNAIVVNSGGLNATAFSIDTPDNWAYEQGILFSQIGLTPNEFGVMLVNHSKPLNEKMKDEGAYSSFTQEWDYPIKNAPLDVFVKYKIDKQDAINVTSKQNATIGNEIAVKIYADGTKSFSGIKFVEYFLMHNKEPYYIAYMANVKDFEKYLPEFEQIVKTFKFTK